MTALDPDDLAYALDELAALMRDRDLPVWLMMENAGDRVDVNVDTPAFELWRRAIRGCDPSIRHSRGMVRCVSEGCTNGGVQVTLIATRGIPVIERTEAAS